jgi:hypothetical protein
MFVLQEDSVIDGQVYMFIKKLGDCEDRVKDLMCRNNLSNMSNVNVASIENMPHKSLTMIDLEMDPTHPRPVMPS